MSAVTPARPRCPYCGLISEHPGGLCPVMEPSDAVRLSALVPIRVYTKAELLALAKAQTHGCGPQHCDCASPAEWIEENLT